MTRFQRRERNWYLYWYARLHLREYYFRDIKRVAEIFFEQHDTLKEMNQ